MEDQLDLFEASYEKPSHLPKHIRLIEFFAGIGAQAKALELLRADFEHWRTCEWSWQSITAYNAIHMGGLICDTSDLTYEEVLSRIDGVSSDYNRPMTDKQLRAKGEKWARELLGRMIANRNFCPDVSRLHASDLGIEDRENNTYVLTYSFPCCPGNTLVLTKKGYRKFSELQVGDEVLTRKNEWHPIKKKFDNGTQPTFILKAQGFAEIECTAKHKFLAREMKRVGHLGKRTFLDPKFMHADELTAKHYLGVPVIKEEIPFHTDSLAFWKLVGMYVGDGWLNAKIGDTLIACNEKKLETAKSLFEELGIKYTIVPNSKHCWNIRTSNKPLFRLISQHIGTGSHDKRIPFEIMALPKPQLQAFFDGYLASDGCKVGKNYQFATVNGNIAYSVAAIVNKLYHRVCNVYLVKTPDKHIIQGREVNQSDWYQLRFKPMDDKQDKAFYEDGYIWYPFKSMTPCGENHVYNMEIDEDHSYIIQGCISANCQDLSLAGRLAGMERGGGTRSGLLWEVERILLECKESDSLPQVLIMENVPQVCGAGNVKPFNEWLDALRDMGYTNYYKILNAKDYGIPQNRRRCFMVSILGEYSFSFPKRVPLRHRLKDFLSSDVDRRYFLPEDLVARFQPSDGSESLRIPSATEKGYMEAEEGDGVLPTWTGARGVVQKGSIPTLLTTPDTIGVVVGDGSDPDGE